MLCLDTLIIAAGKCFQTTRSPGSLIFMSNFQEYSSKILLQKLMFVKKFQFLCQSGKSCSCTRYWISSDFRDKQRETAGLLQASTLKTSPQFEIRICSN